MKRNFFISVLFLALSSQNSFSQVDSTTAPYNYRNLGNLINSDLAELNPLVAADESILFFVREHKGKFTTEQYIWSSEKDENNNWKKAKKETAPFNTMPINSIADIINDGKTVLIKGNYQNKNILPRGFSLVEKINGKWSMPVGLNIEDYENMDKGLYNNATISYDKKVIIFSFCEVEEEKDNNLYISFQKEGVNYSKPVKLPSPLNLDKCVEFAPRISYDAKKIYYSSDRANGIGDNDIYVSERLDDSWMKWSAAENMTNTVNTSGRDSYFSIDSLGEYAYMVSDINSLGKTDIVRVKLVNHHIINGSLSDKRTGKKLNGSVTITTSQKNETITVNTDGFKKTYTCEGQFIVKGSANGYKDRIDTINIVRTDKQINIDQALERMAAPRKVRLIVKDDKGKPVFAKIHIANHNDVIADEEMKNAGLHEVMLTEGMTFKITATEVEEQNLLSKTYEVPPITEGDTAIPTVAFSFKANQIFNFVNVYFKTNSATPEDSSHKDMDLIVEYMIKHPKKRVLIKAHTDDVGNDAHNMALSKRRAESVKKYIVSKGISEKRLKALGLGESKLAKTGTSDEIRALNRRVEFDLIE